MNIKRVAIATTLCLSSPFTIGATYDLLDEQQNELIGPEQMAPPENKLNRFFFGEKLYDQQIITNNKQDHLDIISLLKKDRLNDAENKINTLINQHPNDPELYNLQALLEILKNNNDLAIESFQNAINLDQQNLTAHIGLTKLFLETGNLAKAKEYAIKTLSINDKFILAYFLLADIANKENKQKDIENLLLTAQEKSLGNVQQEISVATNLVKFYVAQQQLNKTIALAQNIIKRYPSNSSALSFLANVQLLNNKKKQAIQTLETIVTQEPKDIHHRLLLAKLLVGAQGKEKQVLKLLDEITSIAPNNPLMLIQKTSFLIKFNRLSEALSSAQKVKLLIPETGLGELLEGDIYLADNKLDQALASYQKAYEMKPKKEVLNVIANVMIANNRQSDAINFLNKELEKNKKNIAAHFKLASIYEMQKNVTETEKHYQAILAEQPDNVTVLNNLAWLYHQHENSKALSLAEKAYQKAPNSAAIADTYGTILVTQGSLKEGIKVLEKAAGLAPGNYDIQYHLANAYVLDGKNNQAIELLNTLVGSRQDFSEKAAARYLLKQLVGNASKL